MKEKSVYSFSEVCDSIHIENPMVKEVFEKAKKLDSEYQKILKTGKIIEAIIISFLIAMIILFFIPFGEIHGSLIPLGLARNSFFRMLYFFGMIVLLAAAFVFNVVFCGKAEKTIRKLSDGDIDIINAEVKKHLFYGRHYPIETVNGFLFFKTDNGYVNLSEALDEEQKDNKELISNAAEHNGYVTEAWRFKKIYSLYEDVGLIFEKSKTFRIEENTEDEKLKEPKEAYTTH